MTKEYTVLEDWFRNRHWYLTEGVSIPERQKKLSAPFSFMYIYIYIYEFVPAH